jgi:hypothetical protein
MNDKRSGAASKLSETPEHILAPLSSEKLTAVTEVAVRQQIEAVVKLAEGILKAVTTGGDSSQRMIGAALGEVNINEDDAKQLVADGEVLRELHLDRQAKDASARAAATKVDAARVHVHQQVQSYASIIRGQLGAQSPSLDQFGIKKIGGVGNRKKPVSRKPPATEPTPAK